MSAFRKTKFEAALQVRENGQWGNERSGLSSNPEMHVTRGSSVRVKEKNIQTELERIRSRQQQGNLSHPALHNLGCDHTRCNLKLVVYALRTLELYGEPFNLVVPPHEAPPNLNRVLLPKVIVLSRDSLFEASKPVGGERRRWRVVTSFNEETRGRWSDSKLTLTSTSEIIVTYRSMSIFSFSSSSQASSHALATWSWTSIHDVGGGMWWILQCSTDLLRVRNRVRGLMDKKGVLCRACR